ncbi:MAG: hypothetical protein KGQ59_12535, partial [Bdellovibrionales bacterium]|nr:hypothetical protein [Bdellovibrionales bacterium]
MFKKIAFFTLGLTPVLSGCISQGRMDTARDSQSRRMMLATSVSSSDRVSTANPVPAEDREPTAPAPVETPDPGQETVYQKSLPILISFGQISQFFSAGWNQAVSTVVRRDRCAEVGNNEYRCGEFPIGRVVSGSSKLLMRIPIPAQRGSEDGVSYSTQASTASVFIDRQQIQGSIPLESLDSLSQAWVPVSSGLGDTYFLKLDPRGGELMSSICIGVPGIQARIPRVNIDGKMTKQITLLPDIRGTFKVQADIGSV